MTLPPAVLLADATDPYLSESQLRQIAMDTKDAGLYGMCVLPGRVRQAALMIARSGVRLRTLISYPTGVAVPSVKALETRLALQDGAHEVALAPNLGYFLGDEALHLTNEIAYVAKALREVAPAKARQLSIVFDMAGLPLTQVERFATITFGAGGHGVHLLLRDPATPDQIRTIARSLAQRSTTAPLSVQLFVPDAATARAILDAGANYIITPNAAQLAQA